MNKSFSKIRHIQESNFRLETRILKEGEKSESEKIKDLKRDIMDTFRNVSVPEFEKGRSTEKEPKIEQIINNIKEILSNY